MPERNTIGHITLMRNRIPRRHCGRELSAALELWDFKLRIKERTEEELKRPEVRDAIFRQLIWFEGEKLISLIEESMAPSFKQKHESNWAAEQQIPISRDDLEHLINFVHSDPEAKNRQPSFRTPMFLSGGFAFDLLLYDQAKRRLRYVYMAYGLGSDHDALTEWRDVRAMLAGYLPRLAGQYFGAEIDKTEFVMIDPLLEESTMPEQLWSLSDLDQLTRKPGTAKRALEIQKEQRRSLGVWFAQSLGGDEAEVDRQVSYIINDLALEELDRAKTRNFETLVPKRTG